MGFLTIHKILLKSLFSKPATQKYPFGPKKHFPKTRGRIQIEIKTCIFCNLCARKCPTQAIVVNKQEKWWSINRMRCITCDACVEVCPKKCLFMDSDYSKPELGHKQEVYSGA